MSDAVYQAHLADLQAESISKLTVLANTPLAQRKASQRKCFLQILENVGACIHALLLLEPDGNNQDLYFWPGYESILRPLRERRIGPIVRFGDDDVAAGFRYSIEDGHSTTHEGELLFTVAAFHHLLGSYREMVNGVQFSPGSTHLWAAEGPKLKLPRHDRARPIEFLEICVPPVSTHADGQTTKRKKPTTGLGVKCVALGRTPPQEWGPTVGAQLNDPLRVESARAWPVPADKDPGAPLPTHHRVRLLLYSLWLAATFRPPAVLNEAWVSSIQMEMTEIDAVGFEALLLRIGQLRDRQWLDRHHVSQHSFGHWYTFVLQPTVDLPFLLESKLLGSAMLFCPGPIRAELLREIRRAVEVIYLNMRYLEIAILNEQQGLQAQAYGFAHDIKKLTAVLSDLWVVPLNQLFHDEADASSVDLQHAIGTVAITQSDLAADLGITPVRSSILAVGTIMRLWSVLDLGEEFKELDPAKLNVTQLARACWSRVKRAAVATMLIGHGYDLSSVDDLRTVLKLRSQLLGLFDHSPFSVVGEAPRLNFGDGRAIIMARLVFSILKNALQHTDPLEPITFSITTSNGRVPGTKLLLLRCTNSRFDWPNKEYPPSRIQDCLAVDLQTSELLASLLQKRTASFEELTPTYARMGTGSGGADCRPSEKAFSSRDTIELCVRTLGGPSPSIPAPNDAAAEYVIEVKIPFEET